MSGPYDKGTLLARIRELEEQYQAVQELNLQLTLGLKRAQFVAWDEGWLKGQRWAFSDQDEDDRDTNPYREA